MDDVTAWTRDYGDVRRQSRTDGGERLLAVGGTMLGLAALALGVLGLVVGDFALQWQPLPEHMPGAYATAVIFTVLGAATFFSRVREGSLAALTALFFAWTLLLHGPRIAAAPLAVPAWLGFSEILAIASGALMLAAAESASANFSRWGALVGRLMFGASLPVFGLSHFVYIEFTASMIPAWIPAPVFWAWFTGACHVAAGCAILSGVLARAASLLFACMVSGFVLLLHVPRVIADPASRLEWTMLVIAFTIAAAAWCAAGSIAAGRRPGR